MSFPPPITPREIAILQLVSWGQTDRQIAAQFRISHATVRTHVQNALLKLDCHTRAHAIATAIRLGMFG